MIKIRTRPCVNFVTLKNGKIVCEKRQNTPHPSLEEGGETNLGFFGKIKDYILNYFERRKFKNFDVSKLDRPLIQVEGPSFQTFCGQTINTRYRFEEDGSETPIPFEPRTLQNHEPFSPQIIPPEDNFSKKLQHEKRIGGLLFRCN